MPAPDIKPKIVELTPELAENLLGRNTRNRNVRKGHVKKLAGAMSRGEWEFNGEAIKVGHDGIILDGQHRILAVIESGVTITALVIEGVDPQTQDTMDGGRARTLGDALKLSDETNVTTLAAALRYVYSYEKTGLPPSVGYQSPTTRQCLAVLERHPGIRQSVEFASDSSKRSAKNFYPKSQIAGYHYIFALAQGAENAETFFYKLATGEELKIGDPIHTLRERLMSDLKGSHGQASSLGNKQKLAFIVRSFNGWIKGEELTRLLFNAGGAHPDRFPKVTGWKYTEHDNGSVDTGDATEETEEV